MAAILSSSVGLFPIKTYVENGITYRYVWGKYLEPLDFYNVTLYTYTRTDHDGYTSQITERHYSQMANKPHWGL